MAWQSIVTALAAGRRPRGDGAAARPLHGPRSTAAARRPATGSSARSSGRSTGSAGSTRSASSAGTSTPSRCWPSASCRSSRVYAIQRLQGVLPLNPTDRGAVSPWGAWNVAVSFVTNTNWQWYSGEATMSHLTQMLALTVQNFVSAAAGIVVAVAIIRGLRPHPHPPARQLLGRPRAHDDARPAAAVAAVHRGADVAGRHPELPRLHRRRTTARRAAGRRQIPGGPFASQEAIKQLGTNGGGPLNANSAHPFENPTGSATSSRSTPSC